MPDTRRHEEHRWSYMTDDQLVTRLQRITRRPKLLLFWEMANDRSQIGRHNLVALRTACRSRARDLGITLPALGGETDIERAVERGQDLVLEYQAEANRFEGVERRSTVTGRIRDDNPPIQSVPRRREEPYVEPTTRKIRFPKGKKKSKPPAKPRRKKWSGRKRG